MKTEPPEPSRQTSRTRWSVVRAATAGDEVARLAALEYLFRRYAPALRSFVSRRFELSTADAEDLVQDFVLNRVLHKSLLASASAERGRFRNFLLRSITHFTVDALRARGARKRLTSTAAASLDQMLEDGHEEPEVRDEKIFNDAFTRQLIGEAIRRTQRHCLNLGREDIWRVFEGRLLGPLLDDSETTSYDDLCSTLGLRSSAEAQNLLVSAKRIFRREFHSIVEEYTESAGEVAEELAVLKNFLQ